MGDAVFSNLRAELGGAMRKYFDTRRRLTLSWIALAVLSVITVSAGELELRLLAGAIVLIAGFCKAWIIIDQFMELRQVKLRWRLLMLGWPLAMALCIGIGMINRLPTD